LFGGKYRNDPACCRRNLQLATLDKAREVKCVGEGIVMAETKEEKLGWRETMLHKISVQDISLVAIGGAIGGMLQPMLVRFDPSLQNPDGLSFAIGPLLGIAAAGISVFVLANSKTDDKPRLLFFSVLCGLAFPSVLTTAIDTLDPQSQAVENKAEIIAKTAAKGKTNQAADELTAAMAQNPASAGIEQIVQEKLEVSANAVVSDLAEKAGSGAAKSGDAIEQLKEIGTTARNSGYDGVALRVTEELKKLESSKAVDADGQADAAQAADAVIGVRLMEMPEAK
jgi:hypothetical protein